MTLFVRFAKALLAVAVLAVGVSVWPALAAAPAAPPPAADPRMSERSLGNPKAPIKVDEYLSLTCSHCADFTTKTLPELEKKYVETGKVRIVYHDFPIDGVSLKAAALARCLPAENYFPFVKTLYANQMTWAFGSGDPIGNVTNYARLAGLTDEQAKACLGDTKLLDAIIAERTAAGDKYKVDATPTFVVNDGAEIVRGAQEIGAFSALFDRLLAGKK